MDSATTSETSSLRKTALNALHRRLGAKMVNFGGWDMPVEYPSSGGLIAEHKAVRGNVGVFDVSHMGDIRIRSGKKPGGALEAVQHITMNDASRLAIGQAQYSAMLYPEGTFVDDVIVHRLGEDDYLLVINAGTREKDINWVRENTRGIDCVVEDLSDAYSQLAIQGPRAAEVVQKLTDAELSGLKVYWFTHATVCGLKNRLLARTGYTGEDGFEIYVPSDPATSERVWNQVIEAGREFAIVPCGLGARNTLRLESKMALYGAHAGGPRDDRSRNRTRRVLLLERSRRTHRRSDERFAFPDFGQKHCPGLRAANIFGGGYDFVCGNSRAKLQSPGGSNSVLQAAEKSSRAAGKRKIV